MVHLNKSALLALVLSTAFIAAPAVDSAWAKDGSSGSSGGGGRSGSGGGDEGSSNGGGRSSGTGNSGNGGSSNSVDAVSSLRSSDSDVVRGRSTSSFSRKTRKENLAGSGINGLQADLARAQRALKEAEVRFNRGLADPNANLRKLEQAIRNAEIAIAVAGARLARASSGQ